MLSSIVELTLTELCVSQMDKWTLYRIYHKGKSSETQTQKDCSTSSHANDGNEQKAKVDPKTVEVDSVQNKRQKPSDDKRDDKKACE